MGRITGYTAETPKNLTTGAGVVFVNFDIKTDTYESAKAKILGATNGGVTVSVGYDGAWTREIDGVPENSIGMREVEYFMPSVTVPLVEIGETQICAALGATTVTSGDGVAVPTGRKLIVPKHDLAATDYMENITILTAKKTGEPLIIQIINALSQEDWEISTEYKAGGTMELQFMGNYDPTKIDEAPIKFYVPTASA